MSNNKLETNCCPKACITGAQRQSHVVVPSVYEPLAKTSGLGKIHLLGDKKKKFFFKGEGKLPGLDSKRNQPDIVKQSDCEHLKKTKYSRHYKQKERSSYNLYNG